MVFTLVYTYLGILIAMISIYIIGGIFRKYYNIFSFELSPSDIFKNLIIGLIITVTVYSILITRGITVSWLYIFLGLIYFYHILILKKKNCSYEVRRSKVIPASQLFILVILLTAFLFFIYLFSLFDFSTFDFSNTYCDWVYYGKTSLYLNKGFENGDLFDNFIFSGVKITPYHYFDLWTIALLSKLFNIPPQIATNIMMPTLFGCIYFFAILGFAKKVNLKSILLAFFLIFFTYYHFGVVVKKCFSLINFSNDFAKSVALAYNVINTPKFYSFALLFCLFLYSVIERKYFNAVLSLLLIPVTTAVAIPSILPATGLLILLWIVYFKINKSNNQRIRIEIIHSVILFCLFLIFTGMYFIFFWDGLDANSEFIIKKDLKMHLSFLLQPLLYLLSYLPYFFIIFFFRKHLSISSVNIKMIGISIISIFLCATLIGIATVANYDGFQFFMNVIVPLLNLVIVWLILNISGKLDKMLNYLKLILYFFIAVSFYFSVKSVASFRGKNENTIYKHAILTELSKKEGPIYCGFIHSSNFYKKSYFLSFSKVFTKGDFIDSYRSDFFQVGLSDFVAQRFYLNEFQGKEIEKERALLRLKEGTFFKYVEAQKMNNQFISIDQSQIDFIEKFDLSYIFISKKSEISEKLKNNIKLIVEEQSEDGYEFYKIITQ